MVKMNKSCGNALTTETNNGCETLKWNKSKGLASRQRTTVKPVSWVYLAVEQQHRKNNVHK